MKRYLPMENIESKECFRFFFFLLLLLLLLFFSCCCCCCWLSCFAVGAGVANTPHSGCCSCCCCIAPAAFILLSVDGN